MKRAALLMVAAVLLGIGTGEYLTRQFTFRRWLGQIVGRGDLQALVRERGIYDRDLDRAWRGKLFALGQDPTDVAPAIAEKDKHTLLQELIARTKLNRDAAKEPLDDKAITRELNLLRWQFLDAKSWTADLQSAATNESQLRREVLLNLRGRTWLEDRIQPQIRTSESALRQYFATHQGQFQEPKRLRASHLFLAAPEGYPEAVIKSKRALINSIADRLAHGESFDALVSQFSEDEATKQHGGDLNYFAAERMLPEVFGAAEELQPGEISPPVRSRLGFHLIRLTDVRPARALTFEEVKPEIVRALENREREVVLSEVEGSNGRTNR